MVQEFLFGISDVGKANQAKLGIEVWYDIDGNITETKIIQKTKVIDPDSLVVISSKEKCQESDNDKRCYQTLISVKFLEPLKDDIMAIKAIDFKKRTQTTFLNDGFVIDSKSLNPMLERYIPGPAKYEGLILVTQTAKYSNIWIAEDGREFEKNSYDTFTQINESYKRNQDTGEPKTRAHSEFVLIKESAVKRAQVTLAEICPKCIDEPYDKINNIIQFIPNPISRGEDLVLQALMVYEAIRAEHTLDDIINERYPNNAFYKNFIQ